MIEPITKREFASLLLRCRPPTGWPAAISVANSGGPDSTCLLYLLAQLFSEADHINGPLAAGSKQQPTPDATRLSPGHPRIVSMTIDHDFQASSREMAQHCESFAWKLGVAHMTTKIPWGKGNFPPKPTEYFERVARDARFSLLFDNMLQMRSGALALAHHLDDQVETSLMRLGKGSSLLGARGMKPLRRWGMLEAGDSGKRPDQQVMQALDMWQIRPLLSVGKDRILATCEANRLDYVTDKTNFQPDITIRNAIRHVIDNNGSMVGVSNQALREKLVDIDNALSKTQDLGITLGSPRDVLREKVLGFSTAADALATKSESLIQRCVETSPPGTVFIPESALQDWAREESLARRSLVTTVLRYVSPDPWGSLRAQAFGRETRVDAIANLLWSTDTRDLPRALVAGSRVMWKYVAYRNGAIKEIPHRHSELAGASLTGWIASRQPPAHMNAGLQKCGQGEQSMKRDITKLLTDSMASYLEQHIPESVEVMWDNRFRIRFNMRHLALLKDVWNHAGVTVLVDSHSKWFLPQVAIHTTLGGEVVAPMVWKLEPDSSAPRQRPEQRKEIELAATSSQSAVRFDYIRPLTGA